MTFLWPTLLWTLAALPLLIALYWWLMRRKRRLALRYATLSIVREAMGKGQSIRRHLPPLLMLMALTLLLVALARPQMLVTLPSAHQTIILAMDVSISMRAADVEPSRIEAARTAAKAFLAKMPSSTRIGIVSFAATASVVQPPTNNHEDLTQAIDRFELQRGTAVGSGILVSLKTLFPDIQYDLRSYNPRGDAQRGRSLDTTQRESEAPAFKPVPPGSYSSAAIILLTDGQTTTGPDPREAAKMASERGVRVYTVGIGTSGGETIGAGGWSMRVRLDEAALKDIATTTLGDYYYAGNAFDLTKVYDSLSSRLVLERKETEITALFAAAAAVLMLIAALLSIIWFHRIT
jgi:Ca-activated chloride channel family protein